MPWVVTSKSVEFTLMYNGSDMTEIRACGNPSAQEERREAREYPTHPHTQVIEALVQTQPWMKRLRVQAKEWE